jgi:ABC-type antimicrobial peptide transport system permease subunit
MAEMIEMHLRRRTAAVTLIWILAGIAILLASVGLYALLSFHISRRRMEFGIRLAVGAKTQDVLQQVLRQGALLACAGILTGLALAPAAAALLSRWLYGIQPVDPITYGVIACSVFVLCIGASLAPARRASSVNPIEVLRHE